MNTSHDVWGDRDLRELVANDPELVAIADAVAYTATAGDGELRRRARRRRPARSVAAAAAVLVAVIAAALVMPWSRSKGSLSDLALAAIGSQPVLHIVGQLPTSASLVDITTGGKHPAYQEQEIWFDASKGLKRFIVRSGESVAVDILETPDGAYASNGRIYDCAWIAAHPAEATRAGVSCTTLGSNPSAATSASRPRPTLDPGLSGFVDRYKSELASGQARGGGSGEADGKSVDWLLFDTADGVEKVALDSDSHRPVLVRFPSGLEERITSAETTEFDPSNFARPKPDANSGPTAGASERIRDLSTNEAGVVESAQSARWVGNAIGDLPLVHAELQSLSTTLADGQTQRSDDGLQLDYGSLRAGRLDFDSAYVRVSQARSRTLGFGYMWGFVHGEDPPQGYLYEATENTGAGSSTPAAVGFIVHDGVYITIQASSDRLLLAAARAVVSAPH